MSLDHLVALLQAPLAGGDGPPDLGARLRAAADELCRARLPPERVGPVRAWRQELASFERLSQKERRVQAARGLRLCAGLRGVVSLCRVDDEVPRAPVREPTGP